MIMTLSSIGRVARQVGRDLRFPAVAVREQPFLVVEQLLPGLGGELEIRAFDDGVHRAGFLAQPAIDAFGHVDVVARCAPAAVLARLHLDGDGLSRADRLAELAGDAALLAVGIAAQRVLAAEARAQGPLLVGIVESDPRPEEIAEGELHAGQKLRQQQPPGRARQSAHRTTLLRQHAFKALTAAIRRSSGRPPSPAPRTGTAAGTPSSPAASAGRSGSAGRSRGPRGTGTAPPPSWQRTRADPESN